MREICPSCGEMFNSSYGDTECEGCRYVDEPEMERDAKTELADKRVFEALKSLVDEYDSQIQFDTVSDYAKGTIRIKIK